MLKREMNKKGQGLSITTIILIILGLVVLIFLILGFTRGFDFLFGKFDVAPGQDLEAVAQSCNIAAQGNLRIDFCTFKEVKFQGKNEFVNCFDSKLAGSITASHNINCNGLPDEKAFCAGKDASDLVNGKTCEEWIKKKTEDTNTQDQSAGKK